MLIYFKSFQLKREKKKPWHLKVSKCPKILYKSCTRETTNLSVCGDSIKKGTVLVTGKKIFTFSWGGGGDLDKLHRYNLDFLGLQHNGRRPLKRIPHKGDTESLTCADNSTDKKHNFF